MKRVMVFVSSAMLLSAPGAAQWFGMPAWNSPKGASGIAVTADYGRTDVNDATDPLKATAFGARASLGLGRTTLVLGASRVDPEGPDEAVTVLGAQGAFRLVGGSLLPVAVNVHAGGSRHGVLDGGSQDITNWLLGVGVSTNLPTPAVSLEPYLSISNRWHDVSGGRGGPVSNLGFVLGANVGFGMVGLHVAYDYEKYDRGSRVGIFGLGAHVALRTPVGM